MSPWGRRLEAEGGLACPSEQDWGAGGQLGVGWKESRREARGRSLVGTEGEQQLWSSARPPGAARNIA